MCSSGVGNRAHVGGSLAPGRAIAQAGSARFAHQELQSTPTVEGRTEDFIVCKFCNQCSIDANTIATAALPMENLKKKKKKKYQVRTPMVVNFFLKEEKKSAPDVSVY